MKDTNHTAYEELNRAAKKILSCPKWQTLDQIRKFLLDHPDANQKFQVELEKYFDKHPEHTERYALLKL